MQNDQKRRTDAKMASAVRRRKARRQAVNLIALIGLVVLVAVIVIASPKEPLRHAFYSIGSEDNLVHGGSGSLASQYAGLVFTEVMASNRTALPDENGGYPDWIEVTNTSDKALNIKDVALSDDDTSLKFLFPDITLAPGERILVMCDKKNRAEVGKTLHAKFALSSNGETLYMYDPNAFLLDSVKTPILSTDESYARQADGSWIRTNQFSPGYENTEAGYMAFRNATMVTDGALVISEVCPDPLTGFRDENGNLWDWVELHNTTDHDISLDAYALSNNEAKPLKWRFPQGAMVPANGYYLVWCSGEDVANTDITAIPRANFKISAEHDTIVLSDSRGRVVDRVIIDNIPEDASYARGEDGLFAVTLTPTPTLPNTSQGAQRMDYNLRMLNTSGVYITEVMASNDTTSITSGSLDYVDWVEIWNKSSVTVDLSGYGFSDNIGRARKWQFPAGTTINPGEYKIIKCDGEKDKNTAAELHASFSLPRAGGEILVLSDPTGKILDKVVLPEIPTNVSYGRANGREGFFYYDTATPGSENTFDGFLGYASAPEFTQAPGYWYEAVHAGLTIPEGTSVYFTLDGSEPTREKGTFYYGQDILLNETTTLRARAFSDNPMIRSSVVATGTYLVHQYHTLPILCVTIDPEDLYHPTDGMLTVGDYVIKKVAELPFPNTVYRKNKEQMPAYEGYLEYYTEEGEQLLSQGVAVGLIGDFSLDMPQKSMKFRAKSLYGEKTFAAAVFDDRPFTEYKSLVARNSGNDCMWTRLQDGFQSRLLDAYGSTVVHQAWKPVAVYLNGQYWGHMNLRERVDRFFIAQHEGLSLDQADEMDILEASGSVTYGSNKEYREMVKKIKAGSPAANPEDLQYILDNVDVDNLFEYMALEMFVGNSDIGNTRFYRLHQEGSKWKWIWYDVDYGLYDSGFNSPWSYTKKTGMGQKNIDNTIFMKLLEHPDYKQKFLEKLADVFKTFTTDYMLSVLEPLVEEITPEMRLHWERWGELNDKYVISEVPTTIDGAYSYWESRVSRLRNVCKKRPRRLWGFIQEAFKLSNDQMVELFGPQPEFPEDAI